MSNMQNLTEAIDNLIYARFAMVLSVLTKDDKPIEYFQGLIEERKAKLDKAILELFKVT